MLESELVQLVQDAIRGRCESQHLELKRASRGTPERLRDTLSSFANQIGGGTILFGVDEEDGFSVAGVYDPQDLQKKVTEQCLQMEPPIRPVFTVAHIDGKTVVSAEIAECDPASKPCFYTGAGRVRGSYVRVGEADLHMTEYEVYSFEAYRRQIQEELRPVGRATLDDLDADALAAYLLKLKRAKSNLARHDAERILALQGLITKEQPTVAGMVLLGEYPQGFLPQLSVVAVVINGTRIGDTGSRGERFVDNQRFEGRLDEMLDATMAFLRRNMRHATVIDGDGKRADRDEYPVAAVREIVLNALIHRDYSAYTERSPVRVALYTDRLEVESPGGLYGRVPIEDLGRVPADTRNPFIAGCMEVLEETENRFSGIPTVMREMERAGLPPAVFKSRRGTFKAILYNGQSLQAGGPEPKAVALDAKAHETASGEKPWGDVEGEILSFCATPRSRREIAEHIGVATTSYVYARYLKPLIDEGALHMTLPEAPKSKNQRFVASARP